MDHILNIIIHVSTDIYIFLRIRFLMNAFQPIFLLELLDFNL